MKKRRRKATAALNKKVLGWALEVDASLSQPRLRIDCLATVRVNFEVEVGAGGKALRAHASDLLAGVNAVSYTHLTLPTIYSV